MVATPNHPQPIPWETYESVRKQLQAANQKIRQLEQELSQERAKNWQERQLKKKKDLKPSEKYILAEMQRKIESPHVPKDEQGFTLFCYETAAENTGLSNTTANRKVEAILEQWPDIPLQTKKVDEYKDGKLIKDRLYIKPEESTNLIQAFLGTTLSEEQKRKQGGNKYECQKCGSSDVKIKRRLHCNCCGHETDLEDSYPNGNLKNNKSKTRKSNLLSEDDITENVPDEGDTSETGKSNLLLEDSEPAKNFEESLQLDDVIQESNHRQVEIEDDDDSNNPPPPVSSSADHDSIIKDWLEQRRGTSRIIQATGSLEAADKYISKSETYEPDIEAFIAGKIGHIYGSRLRDPQTNTTQVLCFEIDQAEYNDQAQDYLWTLARAGAAAVYWQRQRQRGHLEIYFDWPVDPETARLWALEVCPDLEDIPEVYPCQDKANNALSWPLYQRIGGEVYPCKAEYMLPMPHDGSLQECDPTDKEALARLITVAVTPAGLVEEYSARAGHLADEQKREGGQNNDHGGVIGIKPKSPVNVGDKDLAKQAIADFNRTHRIEDIVEIDRRGKFPAVWRGERTPSVALDRDGERATDHGRNGSFPKKLDAYEVYCLVNGIDKKTDLAERCAELRRAEIKIVDMDPPTELFPAGQKQAPVHVPCIVCGTPKTVLNAIGAYTCGTDHTGGA